MTPEKYDRAVATLSGVSKKVLAAVPMAEAWTAAQIASEMKRMGVANPDLRVVLGTLNHLRGDNLVREPEAGKFQRPVVRRSGTKVTLVKSDDDPNAQCAQSAPNSIEQLSTAPSPLERLARLADQLRAVGDQVQTLVAAVEEAALEVQAELEAADAGAKKLRQLQELLRSIGT